MRLIHVYPTLRQNCRWSAASCWLLCFMQKTECCDTSQSVIISASSECAYIFKHQQFSYKYYKLCNFIENLILEGLWFKRRNCKRKFWNVYGGSLL